MIKKILCTFMLLCWVNIGKIVAIGVVPNEKLNKSLQVKTTNGIIQGFQDKTLEGKEFYTYFGIPFARPPVGELRFRGPKPMRKWSGVLDGTVRGPCCASMNLSALPEMKFKIVGSEDCLYLDVFTPKSPVEEPKKNLLPVTVFLVGGAFIGGCAATEDISGEFFMENDVLLVVPAYRVSVFGFASTQDMENPGNWGIKDQLASLEWIQTNIHRFGGDPKRVTLFGQSAGAACVNVLLMSPRASGLFHGVTMASGTSLGFWSHQSEPRKVAFDVGVSVGIETNSSKVLMQELRKLDEDTLNRGQIPVILINFMSIVSNGLPFSPVIEPPHKDAVVTDYPYTNMEKGKFLKVPVMAGCTNFEMLLFEKAIEVGQPLLSLFDLSPGSFIRFTTDFQNRTAAGIKIRNFFLKTKSFVEATKRNIIMLLSEDAYFRPLRKLGSFIAKYSPVYLYNFVYEGEMGKWVRAKTAFISRDTPGVSHSEDSNYLLRSSKSFKRNKDDMLMSRKLAKIYSNFVKTGNPTPTPDPLLNNVTWSKITPTRAPYLEMDKTFKAIKSNLNDESYKFWEDLYETYGEKPFYYY